MTKKHIQITYEYSPTEDPKTATLELAKVYDRVKTDTFLL